MRKITLEIRHKYVILVKIVIASREKSITEIIKLSRVCHCTDVWLTKVFTKNLLEKTNDVFHLLSMKHFTFESNNAPRGVKPKTVGQFRGCFGEM